MGTTTVFFLAIFLPLSATAGGCIALLHDRRKTRRLVQTHTEAFRKLIAEAEILAKNPDAGTHLATELEKYKAEFAAFCRRLDANTHTPFMNKIKIAGLTNDLSCVMCATRQHISELEYARKSGPDDLRYLHRRINELDGQKLNFRQQLALRLARAYCENAQLIADNAPVDWLLLRSTLNTGTLLCLRDAQPTSAPAPTTA